MQNLKIRVMNEQESREVQDILFSVGKTHDDGSTDHYQFCFGKYPHFINCEAEYISASRTGYLSYDEATLAELRDMVVLKRNDVNDATHESGFFKYLELTDGWYYFEDKWQKSAGAKTKYYEKLKLIEKKEMKEYLNSKRNYEFVLSTEKEEGFIEIPEGMNFAYKDEFNIHFTKLEMGYRDSVLVWQREQGEPFLTPECTLNDQYAEIEQVRQQTIDATLSQRQSQYGCYEDVAHVTQQILSALRVGNYDELPAPMKESLHMIASKMARIVNGDPEYLDNWHDIGGYAKLIEKLIKGE